jgi:streptogramin lyase
MISPTGMVSTQAGSGGPGSANGVGSAASFTLPAGLAVDNAGNVYVADAGNNLIRMISPAGVVSTLAGSGAAGAFDNNVPTMVFFNNPTGVAVDDSGNVYVADQGNNEIRKISPAGASTTLAGNRTAASIDGSGTGASFNSPVGIAVDGGGNLYVTESSGNTIRQIEPNGQVFTLAGNGFTGSANGVGTGATFNKPTGIAVDKHQIMYVADKGNNLIRMVVQLP